MATGVMLALGAMAVAPARPAHAEGRTMARELKRLQAETLVSARLRKLDRRAAMREDLRSRLAHGKRFALRPARPADEPRRTGPVVRHRSAAAGATLNVLVNQRVGDLAPGSGQSEVAIAVLGPHQVAAWNDGEGLRTGGSQLGFAWSSDDGATWTDGGSPPNGTEVGLWLSDPVLTVNEKTGDFFLCGLVITPGTKNGLAVCRGRFSGGSFAWQPPVLARIARDTLPDKPWMAADSLTGNVYLAYTGFERVGLQLSDQIEFQRSTDAGTTWSLPIRLSAEDEQGLVQGARPAVGPDGDVAVCWSTVDTTEASQGLDVIRVRRSTDFGLTFGPGEVAARLYSNFGSGAPGFNRGYGFTWPSLAVDRSRSHHRGRVYLTWNESINFFGDTLGALPERFEVEPNGAPGTATVLALGEVVSGTIAPAGDVDHFAVDGVKGTTAVFFIDSTAASLNVALRMLCLDGQTRLAYNEAINVRRRMLVFTFPENGRYFLRLSPNDPGIGDYHIRTGLHVPRVDRARDHRDVFANWSDAPGVWSTPARVNADSAGLDDWLPEIAVSADGTACVSWLDWRDTPGGRCGSLAHVYLARSTDGVAWGAQGPVTDEQTDWPGTTTNIVPNQGDYLGIVADHRGIIPVWPDGRLGDPDVFTTRIAAPPRIELARAIVDGGRGVLEWYAPLASGTTATVYRRVGGGTWTAVATVTSDLAGAIAYVDSAGAGGATVQYRLGVIEDGIERFAGDAELTFPGSALVLLGMVPNPTPGAIRVRLALPDATPATLELLDLAGRTVRRVSLAAGSGQRLVHLSDGVGLPAGLYFVRLTQGARSVTGKVALVR